MSDAVHIDFRKFPDHLHWQYTMHRFAEDEHGTWLWAPAGTVTRRGDELEQTVPCLFIKLISMGSWQSAIWNVAGKFEVYVDINTPPRWHGDRVQMIDLDLDVVRYAADGSVTILDEDEFAEHQHSLGYPAQLIDGARNAAASAFVALEGRHEPFGDVGAARLAEAVALTP